MRTLRSIILSNLVFTLLQPGIVVILIPYLLIANQSTKISLQMNLLFFMGIFWIVLGTYFLLSCILQFAIDGRGTLSPLDPATRLVTGGLYRYSRNPMYLGVIMILIGEWCIFRLNSLLYYLVFVFILFNAFIILYEQAYLKNKFGEEYIQYCKKVRLWI